jgi:hypothetical protein
MFEPHEEYQNCDMRAAQALAELLRLNEAHEAHVLSLERIELGFNLHEQKSKQCPAKDTKAREKLTSLYTRLVDKKFAEKRALKLCDENIQQAHITLDSAVAALRRQQGKTVFVARQRYVKLEQKLCENRRRLSTLDAQIEDTKRMIQTQCDDLSQALEQQTYDEQDVYGDVESVLPRMKQHHIVSVLEIRKQLKTRADELNGQIVTLATSTGWLGKIINWIRNLLGYEKPMDRLMKVYRVADDVHTKFAALCDRVSELSLAMNQQVEIEEENQTLTQDDEKRFHHVCQEVRARVTVFMYDRKPQVVRQVRDTVGPQVTQVADRVFTPEMVDQAVAQGAKYRGVLFQSIDDISTYAQQAGTYVQHTLAPELKKDDMWRDIPSPPPEPEVLTRPLSVQSVAESLSEFLNAPTPTHMYRLEQVMKQYPEFYDEEPEFQMPFHMAIALYPDELGVACAALQAKVQGAVGKSPDRQEQRVLSSGGVLHS